MIKSYRGLLEDDTQNQIRLSTPDGKLGYKIKKFEVISNNPTGSDVETVVSVWKVEQTAASSTIDFSESTLLASAFFSNAKAVPNTVTSVIVFDSEIVNQDIFITAKAGGGGSDSMNYYLELEQIKLSEEEALVSIVKNLRTEQP